MSLRPRSVKAQLPAQRHGNYGCNRLSSVLAVGTLAEPRHNFNADEHDIDFLFNDLVRTPVLFARIARHGERVIHKEVDIWKIYEDEVAMSFNMPKGIDTINPFDNSHGMFEIKRDDLSYALLWKVMEEAVSALFPNNMIRSITVVQSSRFFWVLLKLEYPFVVQDEYTNKLDVGTSTLLAEAFAVGSINTSIGTECYGAVKSMVLGQKIIDRGMIKYTIDVELRNVGGKCASRLSGPLVISD